MEFELVDKKENSLLERTEINAVVSFDGATPQTQQVRETIVQKLGCNPDLTVIRKTEPKYGETKIGVKIYIYKTPEKMKTVEEAFVLKRNKLFEEPKKAEEKPKEEKKEEAPTEEKKEEAPKEEPKPQEKKEEAPKEEEKKEEKPKEEPKPEEKKEDAPKEEEKKE